MKKKHLLLLNLAVIIYIIYPEIVFVFLWDRIPEHYFEILPFNIFFHLSVFYIFYFFIVPYFIKKDKIVLRIFLALMLIVAIWLFRLVFFYFYNLLVFHVPEEQLVFSARIVVNELRVTLVVAVYATFFKLAIQWFIAEKQKADIMNQRQASELAFLKSQINPHFLFNTLNNIYSLVYRKEDTAAPAVMKLSEIIRYMLYDSNIDLVPLEKEIKYLESFVELQQLRLTDSSLVKLSIEGNYESFTIPPMLLISFVENAFKHGVMSEDYPGISINLYLTKQILTFSVINSCKPNGLSPDFLPDSHGIGLQNVRRRLELLFPGRHELEILRTGEEFSVKLEINYR